MADAKLPDFGGYATKAGIRCSDGRTITADAFRHMDGMRIPLVWKHITSTPENILGHGILEARDDGMYVHGYFNETEPAKHSRALLEHGDIESLSIYANQLVEKLVRGAKQVLHGTIGEVSLVPSGANPEAKIDFVRIAHGDGEFEDLDDEAVITMHLPVELAHAEGDDTDADDDDDDDDGETLAEVYDTLSDKQKEAVSYMIGEALATNTGGSAEQSADDDADSSIEHSDDTDTDEGSLEHQEGNEQMTRNIFDQTDGGPQATLTHEQLRTLVSDAQRMGSFKQAFLAHADEYGIGSIDMLFPDAKAVTDSPDFVKRRTEWVASVLNGTKHSPFARIKSLFADITAAEARAKGYMKGNLKKEEFFGLAQRTTTPTTVYKKQKLDRDDIIDITEMDVVRWLWMEMRLMLDEELAGAILVGDGRQVDDPDKIRDPEGASSGAGIRSIAHDNVFYAPVVEFDSTATDWNADDLIISVADAMVDYEGSGSPTLYTTARTVNKILFQKDNDGRRLYTSRAEIVAAMGIAGIVDVPESVMSRAPGVAGIIVNLQDYTVGTNAGGEISKFDDFDIDYNQYKYLLEGRCSGALTKYHSAVVLKDVPAVPAG